MSLPGKFHTNILIDSRERDSGTAGNFTITLDSDVYVPLGSRAYLTCTRWSIDTSSVQDRELRRGRSLQLIISGLATANDVVDMGRGGITTACTAFIPTIDNAFTSARMTSASSHPMMVPSGLSLRRFNCQVREFDGSITDLDKYNNDITFTTTSDAYIFKYRAAGTTYGLDLGQGVQYTTRTLTDTVGDHLESNGLARDSILFQTGDNLRVLMTVKLAYVTFEDVNDIAILLGFDEIKYYGTDTYTAPTTPLLQTVGPPNEIEYETHSGAVAAFSGFGDIDELNQITNDYNIPLAFTDNGTTVTMTISSDIKNVFFGESGSVGPRLGFDPITYAGPPLAEDVIHSAVAQYNIIPSKNSLVYVYNSSTYTIYFPTDQNPYTVTDINNHIAGELVLQGFPSNLVTFTDNNDATVTMNVETGMFVKFGTDSFTVGGTLGFFADKAVNYSPGSYLSHPWEVYCDTSHNSIHWVRNGEAKSFTYSDPVNYDTFKSISDINSDLQGSLNYHHGTTGDIVLTQDGPNVVFTLSSNIDQVTVGPNSILPHMGVTSDLQGPFTPDPVSYTGKQLTRTLESKPQGGEYEADLMLVTYTPARDGENAHI